MNFPSPNVVTLPIGQGATMVALASFGTGSVAVAWSDASGNINVMKYTPGSLPTTSNQIASKAQGLFAIWSADGVTLRAAYVASSTVTVCEQTDLTKPFTALYSSGLKAPGVMTLAGAPPPMNVLYFWNGIMETIVEGTGAAPNWQLWEQVSLSSSPTDTELPQLVYFEPSWSYTGSGSEMKAGNAVLTVDSQKQINILFPTFWGETVSTVLGGGNLKSTTQVGAAVLDADGDGTSAAMVLAYVPPDASEGTFTVAWSTDTALQTWTTDTIDFEVACGIKGPIAVATILTAAGSPRQFAAAYMNTEGELRIAVFTESDS